MQMKTMKVPVVFEVVFGTASEDLVPCLVGSLEELGTWNRHNALVAKKNDKDATKWTVELEIPQMSFFFFNWAMTRNGQFYEEEPTGCRKANVGVFGGVFKSEYGERWTEFSSFSGCQISVSTHYDLNCYEQIVLMGSGEMLGNWKTWVPATSDDHFNCVWTARFELEQGTTEEFKWVILDRRTREIRRWQVGENRTIRVESGLKDKSVFVPWGGRFVKEGLIIPTVTVEDLSDHHSQSLSGSFDIGVMIYDNDEKEKNNSNTDNTNLDLVQNISSVGGGHKTISNEEQKLYFSSDLLAGVFGSKVVTKVNVNQPRNLIILRRSLGQIVNVFTIEEQSLSCFTVNLLDEISCVKVFVDADVIQLYITSLAVTSPLPEITLCIENEMQLGLPSIPKLLESNPEKKESSSSATKFYFSHDRTILSRVPILDNHGESLEFVDRVVFRDGGLDTEDRVIGLGGRQDQDAVGMEKMEITYSDEMGTCNQVEVDAEEQWSGPRQALYTGFTGLTDFCSRFLF